MVDVNLGILRHYIRENKSEFDKMTLYFIQDDENKLIYSLYIKSNSGLITFIKTSLVVKQKANQKKLCLFLN